MSSPTLPIPPSSGYTAIGLGIAAVLSVVAKYTIVPPKYHAFVPYVVHVGVLAYVDVLRGQTATLTRLGLGSS